MREIGEREREREREREHVAYFLAKPGDASDAWTFCPINRHPHYQLPHPDKSGMHGRAS